MCENGDWPAQLLGVVMGSGVSEADFAVLQQDVKYLGRDQGETKTQVKEVNDKLDIVLQFMAAQGEKNENAEKERDRIFKASTLLPVAILTSVISVTVNYMFKTEPIPIKTPDTQAYIMPPRVDQKVIGNLRLDNDER